MEKKLFTSIRAGVSEQESCSARAANGGTRQKRRSLMHSLLAGLLFLGCLMTANTAQAQATESYMQCSGLKWLAAYTTTGPVVCVYNGFVSGEVCGNVIISGDSISFVNLTVGSYGEIWYKFKFTAIRDLTILPGGSLTIEDWNGKFVNGTLPVYGGGYNQFNPGTVGKIKVLGTLNVSNSTIDGLGSGNFVNIQIGDDENAGTAVFTNSTLKRGGTETAMLNVQNGSLELTDCVTESVATGGNGIYVANRATNSVTINGGNIKGAASAVYSLGGTVTIDGGTYASATNSSVIYTASGTLNMSNAAVNSAASYALHLMGGTATVNGTTVTTTGNHTSVHNGGADVTLTNCTVNQTSQTASQAGFYAAAGTSNINSSSISGYNAVQATGGSVTLNGANLNATVGNALIISNANATVNATNTVFTAHEGNPVSPAAINFLASGNLTWGTGNSINDLVGIVALRFTTVGNNFVLPKIEIPYQMEQPITVNQGGSFSLSAGNTLRIDKTGALNIRGEFSANGTAAEKITINKTTTGNAFEVNDGGTLNLTYSNINTLSGIRTNNGTTNLTNSTLDATAGNALIIGHENAEIFLVASAVTASDKDIQYLAGGDIEFDAQSSLTGSNTVYTFEFSSLNSQMDLTLLPKPIVVPNNFTVNNGGIWNIAAGNTFQTGLIKIAGIMNAPSSAGSQITFVSSAGMFNLLAGGTLNASNILVNAAGSAFAMNGGAATVDNSVFNLSTGDGIVFNGASSLTLTNTSFSLAAAFYPLTYAAAGGSLFWGEGNSISGGRNHAQVTFASLSAAMNLPKFPLPFVFKTGGDFTVTATGHLNVESNNIVKFANWFVVKGKLTAQAQNGETILFTSANDDNAGGDTNNGIPDVPAVGAWGGIWFEDATSNASVLSGCELRFGGKNSHGIVYASNLASPTIENCRLSNSYYGFELRNGASPVLTGNNIASSQVVPVAMTLDCNPTMTNNEFSTSDNLYAAIGIIPGTLAYDAHIIKRALLPSPNVTYLLLGTVENPAGKTLTIDAGVVIKAMDSYHYIKNNGTLKALGTESEKIVFTSVHDDNVGNPADTKSDGNTGVPAAGNWSGIYFGNLDDTQSVLDHCIVKYAQQRNLSSSYNGGAITVENASPTISNTTIQLATYGIVAAKAAKPLIENVTIENSASTPVAISMTADPTFVNLAYNGVGYHAIGLLSESVGVSGTLKKRNIAGYNNITYVPLGDITITSGTTVSIEKGIVIKPLNAGIIVNGALIAEGTSSEKIIFTSIKDDTYGSPLDTQGDASLTTPAKGDWYWIKFGATSDDNLCLLDNCVLKYGGKWDGTYRSMFIESANPTIKNTVISGSPQFGIWMTGDAAPDLSENVTIEECGVSPILMTFTCNPVMNTSSPVFAANGNSGLYILNQTYGSDFTVVKRAANGLANVPYVLEGFTVGANATMNVQAGVIFKFRDFSSDKLIVNGAIKAEGTAAEPIVFTSIYDDSKGGITQSGTVAPAQGKWGAIVINNSSRQSENSLKHCYLGYGGSHNSNDGINSRGYFGMLRLYNTYALIEDCQIENAYYFGMGIYGNSNPMLKNVAFANTSEAAVCISMFSNPTFQNITLANTNIYALGIMPEVWTENGTVPKRSFAGYDNVTYRVYDNLGETVINSGVEITVPAGIVFKSDNAGGRTIFRVKGKLNVQGTAAEPVVFTDINDDRYGSPADLCLNGNSAINTPWQNGSHAYENNRAGVWFDDISNDASVIDHAVFAGFVGGIGFTSAAPTVKNSTIEKCKYGLLVNGSSQPEINACTFNNITYAPVLQSLKSSIIENTANTLSGTTYRTIAITDEELTDNYTLNKRSFAGIENIPYWFYSNYAVGTSASLNISAGVICKFSQGNYSFLIKRTFKALGTASEKVVFTALEDDFYGGDTQNDGQKPISSYWCGFRFEDSSDDLNCVIDNAIIRYAGNSSTGAGVYTVNASPTLTKSVISDSRNGVWATGASNPVINNCDIYNIANYGVNNVNGSFTIDATNNWWGNNSGPKHSGNPGGTGATVSDMVNYTPFVTGGTANPILGDVSLNGIVQAYDASLILQHTVNNIILTAEQLSVADVSGDGTVGALDAAYILQFVAGITQTFPAQLRSGNVQAEIYGKGISQNENIVTVPVYLACSNNIYGVEWTVSYDKAVLRPLAVNAMSDKMFACRIDEEAGKIHIALADAENIGDALAQLQFEVIADNYSSTYLTTEKWMINEFDLSENANAIEISIQHAPTGIDNVFADGKTKFEIRNRELYYTVSENTNLIIAVYNVSGQLISMPVNKNVAAGEYSVSLGNLAPGVYIIRMQAGKNAETRKAVLK